MKSRTILKPAGRPRFQAPTTMSAIALALLALGVGLYFNRPAVADDRQKIEFGAEIEHPFGEKALKGTPFSAQVIIEKSQTLPNGTHLYRKLTGALYRDNEGRTRQEFPRDGEPEHVRINDNVSGVLYELNMFQRSVSKIYIGEPQVNREMEERRRNHEIEAREKAEKTKSASSERARNQLEREHKIESLGVQNLEGMAAEGKRFTITVPAGTEGNDQPMEIVSERWYSPDLQIVVMSKFSDPRTGDVVYRLANVNRTEPARALFEAPPEFTVTEEKREFRRKEQ